MCYRVPSQSDLSESSSENLARKVRHDSCRARQKRRQEQAGRTCGGTRARQAREEHYETRRERVRHRNKRPPTPEERTAARERFNRPGKAKVSSSSSSVPPEPRSASSSEPQTSPLKRGLHYIYETFIPHLNLSGDCPTPTGSFSNAPGAYPGSFTQPQPQPQPQFDQSVDCPTPTGSFSNAPGAYPGSFTQPQPQPTPPSSDPVCEDEDMSDGSCSPSSNSSANTSTADSSFTSPSSGTDSSNPVHFGNYTSDSSEDPIRSMRTPKKHNFTDHENADPSKQRFKMSMKAAEASRREFERKMKHYEDEERRRKMRERIRLEKERQEEEERRKREEEEARHPPETEKERFARECLQAYEEYVRKRREKLHGWLDSERKQQDRWNAKTQAKRAQEWAELERKRKKAREEERARQEWQRNVEAEEQARKAEEEERKRREAFYARPRERTSTSRSTHSRSHPYARSAKLGRSHSGRHFNPAPPAPAASSSKSADPLVAHFEWYESQWAAIASLSSNSMLAFASIPWPLLTLPRNPADVTPERVREFMRHAKRRAAKSNVLSSTTTMSMVALTKKEVRLAAKNELKNWHSDKFTTRVLARIPNDAERDVVRTAADVVQKTLTNLMSVN